MKPLKKEDLSQEIFDIYDEYVHSRINRREFVNRLSTYAVGGLTVGAILSFLLPNYAEAKRFQQDDPRLITSYEEYDSQKGAGKMRGLLARPADKKGKLPGIIVVHENRGLNPYIEDVAQQAALDGFIAFAPDALTPLGGYPGSDDEGRAMQAERDREEMLQDFIAAFEWLKSTKLFWKCRRSRLLLWGMGFEYDGGAPTGSEGCGTFLWGTTHRGRGTRYSGSLIDPLCGKRSTGQRRMASLRSCPKRKRKRIHCAFLSGYQSWVSQSFHPAI